MDIVHQSSDDLFSQDHIARMVRFNSGRTSIDAAAAVAPKRSALKAAILEALRHHGPMTDEQLEQLPQFSHFAPSTVRKRRSELSDPEQCEAGVARVVAVGIRERPKKTPMTVWGLA